MKNEINISEDNLFAFKLLTNFEFDFDFVNFTGLIAHSFAFSALTSNVQHL